MNYIMFTNLLTAHFLADFPLQKDSWITSKKDKKLHGMGMWLHGLVVFACTLLAFGSIECLYLAITIAVSHLLIDLAKVTFTRSGPRAFALDQVLHIGVLIFVSKYATHWVDWEQWSFVPDGKELLYPALVCAYLFCLSPANYIIREVVKYCHVETCSAVDTKVKTDNAEKIKRSGMLIGSMERFLVLTFILVGNYEAAGLTVAAKSLLRFNDNEGPRTEYVLVGTLLSISVAVVAALTLFKFVMNMPIIKMG